MSKEGQRHIKACQNLHEATGPSAVYDYANRNNITDWRECKGCETATPVADNTCLVCGGDLTGRPHVTEQTSDKIPTLTFLNDKATNGKLVFTAVKRTDPLFPGIDILVNGEHVATVEFSSVENEIRTLAWKPGIEDYATKTVYK